MSAYSFDLSLGLEDSPTLTLGQFIAKNPWALGQEISVLIYSGVYITRTFTYGESTVIIVHLIK